MQKQKERLEALLNTMKLIEVRGESAIHMANCLQYVGNMLKELDEPKDVDASVK